ncbi:hypothetical protein RCL1_003636 [Eukaryota sp. TZLM3-RCL]
MGKSEKKAKTVKNFQAYGRVNVLYQHGQAIAKVPQEASLLRHYSSCLRQVSKKAVLKLHPALKRQICSYCSSLLVPGVTVSVRSSSKRVKLHCSICGHVHVYDAKMVDHFGLF